MINHRPTRSGYIYGGPACEIKTTGTAHTVFTSDGNLSRAQSILYESGALEGLLQAIAPHEGEEINISQRLVRVYLRTPTKDRVMAVIHAVIDLMPHERRKGPAAEFANLPDKLRPLVPLMAKWAIDDDEGRLRKLTRSAHSTLQKLVGAVVPLLPAIDEFLDSFGPNPPEEACVVGSLAHAALEAQSLLAKKPTAHNL
jgi:hypothetical protein